MNKLFEKKRGGWWSAGPVVAEVSQVLHLDRQAF